MAPEVRNGESYGQKADVWSIGIIFFMMIYPGELGMLLNNKYRVALKMVDFKKKFVFDTKSGKISEQASDFLRKTIVRDQGQRLDWEGLLSHPLFQRSPETLPNYLVQTTYKFESLQQDTSTIDSDDGLVVLQSMTTSMANFGSTKESSYIEAKTSCV